MITREQHERAGRKNGVALGGISLLFWSTSSATTVFAGDRVGPWQFLALTGLIAGVTQIVLYRRLGMSMRRILLPPPRLLALIVSSFVVYMFVYTAALVLAGKPQKVGVNLLNFLWPTLTVLLSTRLIPGSRMSVRLLAALVMALAGVLLANLEGLRELWMQGRAAGLSVTPYVLGLMAGISWAVYSVMLARWKSWAQEYSTSTPGFLITSATAFAICAATRTWEPMTLPAWAGTIYMALGPQAAAYLLWELALHRAAPHTLGLMASGNAVLSTLWLFAVYPFVRGSSAPPNVVHCLLAAALIATAVAVGTGKSRDLRERR